MWPHNELLRRIGRIWLFLFLPFWIAVFIIGTSISYRWSAFAGRPIPWSRAATVYLIAYSPWALVLTPIILYISWRFPFRLRSAHKLVPIHIVGVLSLAATESLIRVPIQNIVFSSAYPPASFWHSFERIFLAELENNIWMYVMVAVTATGVSYYEKLRREEVRSIQLETQLARAQLSILKMQLQPHFLFNALHSIAALMHQDVRTAEKMIASLGDLLRMSIAEGEANEVTLKQELELVEKYLEIQKLRFQEQLSVAMTIDPDTLTALVPYFLLQPLVENAIKHGTSKRTGAGRIDIDVRRKGEGLHFRVTNDVPAVDSGEINVKDGLGLANIKVRLHTLYGDMQHLEITSLPGHKVEVDIAIPFRVPQPTQNCADSTGNC